MGRAQGNTQGALHTAAPRRRSLGPQTMYHVAPRFARSAILTKGLRGDPDEWDELVWVWDNLAAARAYADTDEDVYCVDVRDLSPEPGGNPPTKEGGIAHAVIGPVSPSLLKRL